MCVNIKFLSQKSFIINLNITIIIYYLHQTFTRATIGSHSIEKLHHNFAFKVTVINKTLIRKWARVQGEFSFTCNEHRS